MSIIKQVKCEVTNLNLGSLIGSNIISDSLSIPAIKVVQGAPEGINVFFILRDKLPPFIGYQKDTRKRVQVSDCDPDTCEPIEVILTDQIGQMSISNIEQCHLLHQDIEFAETVLTALFTLVQGLSLMSCNQKCAFQVRLHQIKVTRQPSEVHGQYHQAVFYACTELLEYFLRSYDFQNFDSALVS